MAASGLWFGNGALFVAPACAAILFVECWRQGGWRLASWTAATSVIWFTSFALAYWLQLRHSLGNPYLQNYWAFAFPPAAGDARETLGWLARQVEPFAIKPGGTFRWLLFWCVAAFGIAFAVATRRPLGWLVAAVPVSAAALAIARLVPPVERLVVWTVPAMYVAIGLCADAAVWLVRRSGPRWRTIASTLAAVALVAVGAVVIDIVQRGKIEFLARPLSNYGLDDRSSVRLLLKTVQPGDAVATTHFGLAGLWWYGRVNISGPDPAGTRLQDGNRIFEIGHSSGATCDGWVEAMNATLRGHRRLVVYLGFRMNVLPEHYDRLVMKALGRRFALVGYREYAENSRVAVFDLEQAPRGDLILPRRLGAGPPEDHPAADGCVTFADARRW
jgi:hypothetical protein